MKSSRKLRKMAAEEPNAKRRKKLMRDAKLMRVSERIWGCQDCALSDTRTKAVPFDGKPDAELIFMGEGPGANEDARGVPFVGRAGGMLEKALRHGAGLERSDAFVLNVVACRPPGNRNPTSEELAACSDHVRRQLALAHSWVGITLGRVAFDALVGERDAVLWGKPLRQVVGVPMWKDGRIWVPAYHPAYVLRNPMAYNSLVESIQMAMAIKKGSAVIPQAKPKHLGLSDQLRKQVEDHGWALVWSNRLQQKIVYVINDEVVVPDEWAHYVRYTAEEMLKLGELAANQHIGTKDLQRIHLVKKELGGHVLA
jgi:DNA polymerase